MNSFEGGVARNVWRMACLLDATHLRLLNFLTPFDRMCFYSEVHLTKIALFHFLISRDIVSMRKKIYIFGCHRTLQKIVVWKTLLEIFLHFQPQWIFSKTLTYQQSNWCSYFGSFGHVQCEQCVEEKNIHYWQERVLKRMITGGLIRKRVFDLDDVTARNGTLEIKVNW